MPKDNPARQAHAQLLKFALAYPGAWEDHPWGETVAKVKTKVFVFFGKPEGGGLGLSVKLPQSGRSRSASTGSLRRAMAWARPAG